MADDARSLAPRRRPHRPILVVANPSPDSDSDSTNERSLQRPDGHLHGRNAPPSPTPPSPSIDKSFHVQLVSSREPGPLTTTNLPSSHFRQHPASQSNPALSSPSGTSSPPPSTPGQSLPPSDLVPDAPTNLDFSFGPSNSSDALVQQQHVPFHASSASHLLGKIKAHIPRMHHDRRLSNSSRPNSSPTTTTPSEPDGNRVMNDGRSPPVDKSMTRIFVTGDSDQYYTVDITGFRNAAFIKELIFSKLRIEDEEQTRYSVYRTEIGAYAIGDALPDEQLYELCRDHGDAKGSLKFLVANSSAVVHERNQPLSVASPTVSSIQPPVLIPSGNSMYSRPHPRQRSRSRHGSVSSASERLDLINGFDISLSDDQNGADAESHRSTLRPPPKLYAVSSQNLVPPSPRGSRKPSEPRNGSPARSNPRAHSPFLSPDRSGPHSPDLRRGRPSPYTPQQQQQQPRPGRASPERSHPVCDDRAFNGCSGTSPHGRSGSDPAAERERSEILGDIPRSDERMPGKRRVGASKKDLESSKLNREPSWVIVGQEGARLPRVGREPKSSPHYQTPNSTLSRPPGIPHIPRQQPPPPPGGDREQRSSGRQAVPPGWAVQWKPPSGDPSSPTPSYNLKMAKSTGNLRDKSTVSLLTSAKTRPAGPVPPLPLILSPGKSTLTTNDGTSTSLTVTGGVVGPSLEREVSLPTLNDPPKAQAEPSRPPRVSPTNPRPIRPLPQKAPGQPLPEVAVTAASPQPPFPLSPPVGLSMPTNLTQGILSTQPDPIPRPRSVLDEESMSQPPLPLRLQRPVDSSVFSEPLQESDPLRSPLPRFPRQLPPPVSREDSGPQPATRILPIPGGTPAMDDRSPDIRPSSLNDGNPTPASRTPPRSPISPRNPLLDPRERIGPRPDLSTAVSIKTSPADVTWIQSQSRDLIDFHKPAEQTVMRDDNTLKAIQHLLDNQSSDEATMVKPKSFVLPAIPPPPPLQAQTLRKIGYVPPPPPLPKPPPVPFPVTHTLSNTYIPHTPLSPDSQPSDQDGSDSEAGTLWQKPMIEDDSLADRLKSTSRGPPLTVKIDEQSSGLPMSQIKSSGSSGGGLTIIPNNFPPPPKHPPPSPPLPHRGTRTPTARQPNRRPSKSESTFQDSSWASRPNPEEVLDRLEIFFPDHDLDKPVIEASSGGTSPTTVEHPPAPLLYNGRAADKRARHKKSIRVVAEEHNLRQDRTSRLQSSSAANVFRKRSTKLWDSRVEEVTPGQITSGMPSIPDSPSVSGSGTTAPKPLTAIFKWVRGELIGKGNFGRVYLALNATTGEMIAVKQVEIPRTASDKNDSRQVTVVEALKLESETLKDLDHPNIVQYLGFEETPNFLSIFLEYVPGGSVGSCLRKYGRFEQNVTKYFTEQILSGLEYLHSKGILHRDLKADNILVEKTGICKISDFGISKRTDDINEQNVLTAMQGTVFWMAPEVVNTGKRGYNAKVDIWSVGCVVLEMWAGERPWRKEEAMACHCEDDFRRKCFAINPDERPSAADLRKHPYLHRPQGWAFSGLTSSHEIAKEEEEDSDDY
ncbi:MAP kinase [Lactarius vividus]|nr:MAP kinase [Lactarius vividus]